VLQGVADGLADHEPRRRLDLLCVAPVRLPHLQAHWQPQRQILKCRCQSSVLQDRGVQAVGERAQLRHRRPALVDPEAKCRAHRVGTAVKQPSLQVGGEAEKPLLSAVVQVALHATPLLQLSGGDPGARGTHLFQLQCNGGAQAARRTSCTDTPTVGAATKSRTRRNAS